MTTTDDTTHTRLLKLVRYAAYSATWRHESGMRPSAGRTGRSVSLRHLH